MSKQALELYAISCDNNGFATINSISLNGMLHPLFGLGYNFEGSLASHPVSKLFYAVSHDATGFATLHTISLNGAVHSMFGLGYGFTGGLTYRYTDKNFYALATDRAGFSTLKTISLSGAVKSLFGLGLGFDTVALSTAPKIPGSAIWIHTPLQDERFVKGEAIRFEAVTTRASASKGFEFPNGSHLEWVYKYGLYDPQTTKDEARNFALSLLQERFCAKPTHSNPDVQAILDELLEGSTVERHQLVMANLKYLGGECGHKA